MVVRRIGPLSLARITGVLYALIGVLIGGIISLASLLSTAFVPQDEHAGFAGLLFGAAAIVVLPIFYGALGFLMSLVTAAVYNLLAGWMGGVELDLQ